MDDQQYQQLNKGNLSDYIYSIAEQFPDATAVLHPKKISFSELRLTIDDRVYRLSQLGLRKGHYVLLLLKPGAQLFILVFAMLRIGAIPVMIDPGMGAKAMSKALLKLTIDVFVGDPKAHLLRLMYPRTFRKVFCFIGTGQWPFLYAHSLRSLRAGPLKPSRAIDSLPSDEAAVFFTSGSTGAAKAVLYRNSMLHAQIDLLQQHFGYGAGEIDCCTFPLTGLLVMCLGLSVVFADMNMTKPARLKPAKLIRNIQEHGCTHLFCSPMVLQKLTDYGKSKSVQLPTLKRVMTAGAIVPPPLLRDFRQLLSEEAEIHTPYGATEALPVTDIADKELEGLYGSPEAEGRGLCVGYPLAGIEMKIIEIDDDEIPNINTVSDLGTDAVGEIIVKGPLVSQEYLAVKNPYTGKIWDPDNSVYWHRMGDLGRRDGNGRIWFYGRKSQRVNTRDGVLYTTVVEAVFNKHPKVRRSALIGIQQHGETFKTPAICIQPNERLSAKEKTDIIKELKQLGASQHIAVETFFYFSDFPVDPRHNAKIYREKLTQWAQK